MGFSTNECAWSQTSVTMLGRRFVGIRGFEYKKTTEKELLYGAGNSPIDIQEGNIKIDGHIKLLKFEVDMLNDAAQKSGYNDITEVPAAAIVISVNYQQSLTSQVRTAAVSFASFTEMPFGMDQGAKQMEVTLPFVAMQLVVT